MHAVSPDEILWAQVTGAFAALTHKIESIHGIANRLREFGVRGTVCDAGDCPLSNYIRERTGLEEVFVGVDQVSIQVDFRDCVNIPLPQILSEFEHAFDMGAYPDLCYREEDVRAIDPSDVPGSQTDV